MRGPNGTCVAAWALLALAGSMPSGAARAADRFVDVVRPILVARCAGCHGGAEPAGGVDMAGLADERSARRARRTWRRAAVQIEDRTMPPADADPLAAGERAALLDWMRETLALVDPAGPDPGPALVRRLSRPEYERTIRDLLGVDGDVAAEAGLADESQGHGFANRVAVLDLSPALMEKYFAAADIVLGRLLATPLDEPPEPGAAGPQTAQRGPAAASVAAADGPLVVESKCAGTQAADNQLRPHLQIVNSGTTAVPLRELTVRYWFTADGATDFQHWCDYARVDARNVTRVVRRLDTPVNGADAYLEVGFVEGTLEPGGRSGEVQVRVAQRDWAAFDQANDHSFDPRRTEFVAAPQVTLHRQGRLVWGTEPSGPPAAPTARPGGSAAPAPPAPPDPGMVLARRRLFSPRPGAGLDAAEAARRIIAGFARRAWRRPVDDGEVDALLAIRDRAAERGADFDAAVRPALQAVLVSPHFLFRVERDPPARGGATFRRVEGHELAVRLSYFLWSSMPDDELFGAAERGELSDPAAFERQARRMLAHPRARALTENFAGPWLQLGRLATSRPTEEFFPGYTPAIRAAMAEETTLFFEHIRQEDRSLLDVIDCDYTFVNEDLARHYGLTGVRGGEMRRVSLRPEDRRGGILGMGSMLTATSHTYRTSPTLRGKYVLEVLLGTPPPPPPANVGVLQDEARGRPPRTFRESLSRHASVAACAACHARIDPLGFGLEQYDGVGRWRGADVAPPDAAGTLPDGTAFSGPIELKRLLLQRRGRFLRNLGEQMLGYALGRPLADCDDEALAAIESALRADEPRLSTLVVAVATSFPFQHRRLPR